MKFKDSEEIVKRINNAIDKAYDSYNKSENARYKDYNIIEKTFKKAIGIVNMTPTEDCTKKIYAEWILVQSDKPNEEVNYICSYCKVGGYVLKKTKYCPNCGAIMKDNYK